MRVLTFAGLGGCADDVAPVLSGGPGDLEATTDTDAATGFVTWPAPSALDETDGPVSVHCHPAPGAFPAGDTQVLCTATDAAGNTATHAFRVRVTDVAAPEFRSWPTSLSAEADASGAKRLWWPAPEVDDLVSGSLRAHCTPAAGSDFAVGETLVHCTAEDAAGNASTLFFPVRVSEAPGQTKGAEAAARSP